MASGRSTKHQQAPTGTADGEDRDLHLDLYRRMLLIRRFEDKVQNLFLRGDVYGSTHLCTGQEAVSVGVTSVLRHQDRVACTYRGHGHAIALGCDPTKLMAELLGRATGTCGGRAGSMNLIDLEHGLIGCFGIVGGSVGAATGAGLSVRRKGGVAVAFFGDGAVNQAYFYECLNLAKVLALPVIYVCENNQYGEYTRGDAVTPGGILPRPQAMGIPVQHVDGQDVRELRRASLDAVEEAAAGNGPVFIEANTYRYADHGRGDPVSYRPQEEIERWKERDPLDIAHRRLENEYGIAPDVLTAAASEIEAEVERIAQAALEAPFPKPEAHASEFAPWKSA